MSQRVAGEDQGKKFHLRVQFFLTIDSLNSFYHQSCQATWHILIVSRWLTSFRVFDLFYSLYIIGILRCFHKDWPTNCPLQIATLPVCLEQLCVCLGLPFCFRIIIQVTNSLFGLLLIVKVDIGILFELLAPSILKVAIKFCFMLSGSPKRPQW